MENLLQRVRAALAGRYEVASEAGRGAMAVVYRAVDRRHDRTVAVKVLQPQLASAVGEERFLHEIRLAAGLAHPYILPVLDSDESDGLLYYVMPFITGETLAARLAREGELPVGDAVKIASEIAEALGHAHAAGVLHRDVKPSNILLTESHALLADFGIARALARAGGERLTATGLSVGSPAYMSPQQADPEAPPDPRDDQYSLACVLYQMLAGAPPFAGGSATSVMRRHAADAVPPVRTVRPAVPTEVEAAIERAMAKSPADRFGSMEEFAGALAGEGGPVRAPRKRAWVGLGALVLAGLAAFVGLEGIRSRVASVGADTALHEFAVLPCRAAAQSDSTYARNLASSTGYMLRAVDPRYSDWWVYTSGWNALPSTPDFVSTRRLDSLHARLLVDCAIGPWRNDTAQVAVSVVGPEGIVHDFSFEIGRRDELVGSIRLAEELLDFRGGTLGSPASKWTTDGLAWSDFLSGDARFLNYDLAEADSLYASALERDPHFGLVLWRLDQVHRWQWVLDTRDLNLDSLLEADHDRFDPRDLELLQAAVEDWGPRKVAMFDAMIEARPRDHYTLLVYGDELMHRGVLAEMGLHPERAADVFARVLEVNPAWIAGWDHLTTVNVLLGDSEAAEASLDALCQRRPGTPGAFDPCPIWTLGVLERFHPGSPELAAVRAALAGQPDGIVHRAARGARYANLYDAQLHLGKELIGRAASPDSVRRSGVNSVGIALAALGLPGRSIETFTNGANDPESRLFADMWAVVPASLGLEGFDGSERPAAARLAQVVDDPAADSLRRARAAWALALRAAGARDDEAFDRRLGNVEALSPADRMGADRLATLLHGVEAALRGDQDGALKITEPLLADDSIGSTQRPFGRSATYLLRGTWHREAGNPAKALDAWLWHWNTATEAAPVAVQAVEVDGALAGWAHLRSARLARSLAAGDPAHAARACREASDALYFWGGRDIWMDRPAVEPAIAELVAELNEILASDLCPAPDASQ
ncbi:MAG TPA: protein kinase [Gemmatimonadota bacterium]|nr:protein kinase [Gemmatimonadota bacterium]